MKSRFCNGILAAAIAVTALSGVARADSDHEAGCTKATLKGDYAFTVNTWTLPPSQIWTPGFVVGLATFGGKGEFTQIDYTAGSDLPDFRRGVETGTYTVNRDCTGRATIFLNVGGQGVGHGVIDLVFVISNGGRAIRGVVAQLTPPGAPRPATIIDRVDFWKVGEEEAN